MSSTCEIITSLLAEEEITPSIATYLYSGIYTDTQGFKYNMSDKTFENLAILLRRKADTSINSRFDKKSSFKKKNEGIVSASHKFYGKDLVGTILKKNDIYAKSIVRNINTLLEIDAKLYFCACIDMENTIHVEIRSAQSSNFDVALIAKKYGGGGHFHASGFSTKNWKTVYEMISDLKLL